jgi:predicted NAD/FAD-dependent oxidoreductase|tara:strand:- start:564 stop:875 length:312 start_codon:yes stop_codon:yes gene_type:complete
MVQRGKSIMIYLKDMSEFDITHLVQKGGMLIHNNDWSMPKWASRYLITKKRKQTHMLNHSLKLFDIKEMKEDDWSTTKLWRKRHFWAYIPPTKKKRKSAATKK